VVLLEKLWSWQADAMSGKLRQ